MRAQLASRLGLLALARIARARQLIVIAHHGVVPDNADELSWQPLRSQITVSQFRRQVEIISRHYQWVNLDQAMDHICGRAVYKNPVLMTFDDGYRNNLELALPILKPRGVKPVLFIATGFMNDSQPFWFDRFDYAIQQISSVWTTSFHGRDFEFRPNDRSQQQSVYAQLRAHAKALALPDSEFNAYFAGACTELEASSGKSLADIQSQDLWASTATAEALRASHAAGEITIGSHTVDHIRIAHIDAAARRKQLVASKAYLETITGSPVKAFCYPNGSWSEAAAQDVAAADYTMAVTSDNGFNRVGCNPYTLHRAFLPVHADPDRLLGLLSGATAIYAQASARLGLR